MRVPVNGSDTPAITEAALFDNAASRYGLTGSLYLSGDGRGHRYVMASVPGSGTHRTLARLLLLQPKSYRIRYRDGDPFNLLPENLRLSAPWADKDTAAAALAVHLDHARQRPEVGNGAQA